MSNTMRELKIDEMESVGGGGGSQPCPCPPGTVNQGYVTWIKGYFYTCATINYGPGVDGGGGAQKHAPLLA